MRRLQASWTGAGVPAGDFAGTVHSVFRRACNIALDGGPFLSVLAGEHGRAPGAITVDLPAGFSFLAVTSPGAPAAARAGWLRAGDLAVRLPCAAPWHGRLDDLGAAPAVDMCPALRQVNRLVRSAMSAASPALPLPRERVVALARALRDRDACATHAAVTALAGCGAGLTPAGDDVLIGVLAGLWSTCARQPAAGGATRVDQRRVALVSAAVRAAASRTNLISAALLRHAANGEFAERLVTLARCVAGGEHGAKTVHAARAALAVGATSGADGVRGLVLGLAIGATDSHELEQAA